MRVYITGRAGSQSAFKITTSQVISNIDSIIEGTFASYIEHKKRDTSRYNSILEWVNDSWNARLPVMYYGEMDGGISFKRMGKLAWKEAYEEYAERFPDKYAKFELVQE